MEAMFNVQIGDLQLIEGFKGLHNIIPLLGISFLLMP